MRWVVGGVQDLTLSYILVMIHNKTCLALRKHFLMVIIVLSDGGVVEWWWWGRWWWCGGLYHSTVIAALSQGCFMRAG